MRLNAVAEAVVVALLCIPVQTRADPTTREGPAPSSPPTTKDALPKPDNVEPELPDSPGVDDDEEEGGGNELSGYFSLAWHSGGVAAGLEASDAPSLEADLFLYKPMKWADLSFYLAISSALDEDSEGSWMEGDVFLTRELNDNISIGIGLNNYYFPSDDESPPVHEIALRLDYDGDLFGADLELDQQYATYANYTYLSASIWHDFSLIPRLTVTPSAEMTVILNSGRSFETSGLETFFLGADIFHEIKDSIYLYFSAMYEADVAEDPWMQRVEYAVGVSAEF